MAVYLVIFGAAVRADGTASGSLRRRCELAVAASRGLADPRFLASGGVGRFGAAEALVMRDILIQHGIEAARIMVETQARDTLESVRYCTRLLHQRGDVERVLVCSSDYHGPRCVLLFRLAGFSASAVPAQPDRRYLGWGKWLRYVAKEAIATPWDALVLLGLKMGGAI